MKKYSTHGSLLPGISNYRSRIIFDILLLTLLAVLLWFAITHINLHEIVHNWVQHYDGFGADAFIVTTNFLVLGLAYFTLRRWLELRHTLNLLKKSSVHIDRLKQTQQALQASEQRFRDFAEAGSDWYWEMDAELRFSWFSEHVETITGIAREWHYGKTREEIGVPDIEPAQWLAHLSTLASHQPFRNFEYRRTGPNGTNWLRTSGIPIFDATGNFKGYRGVGTDVTALYTARDQLLNAIDLFMGPFALYDADDRLVICNQIYRELLGAKLGMTFEEMLHAQLKRGIITDAVGREEAWLTERMAHFRNPQQVLEVHREDGICFQIHEQRMPDGSLLMSGLDISEQKNAYQALRASERRLSLALEGAELGTWDWQITTGKSNFNIRFAEMLGYTLAEVQAMNGTFWEDRLHPKDKQQVLDRLHSHSQGHTERYSAEYRMRTKSGEWKWILAHGRAVEWNARHIPSRITGIHLDLTERKLADESLRVSEMRFRRIFENGSVAMAIISANGNFERVNESYCQFLGYDMAELIGQHFTMVIHPDDLPKVNQRLQQLLMGNIESENYQHERRYRHSSGYTVWGLAALSALNNSAGKPYGFVVQIQDITQRKAAETALFAEQERLRLTLQSISDAVITTDVDGCIDYLNPMAEMLTGWPLHMAHKRTLESVLSLVDEQTKQPIPSIVSNYLYAGNLNRLNTTATLVSRGQEQTYVVQSTAAPIRSREGSILGVVLVFRDVTQERTIAKRLAYQAHHDSLTGLGNRDYFEQQLLQILENPTNDKNEHTLCYIDLDKFKIINDLNGHIAGDELIRQLGKLLSDSIRQCDSLARLSGDEFGLLLPYCSESEARILTEKLRQRIEDFRFSWGQQIFRVTASIGLVAFSCDSHSLPQPLLSTVDNACYLAKERGGNTVYVYQEDDHTFTQRISEMRWITRIEKALEEQRLQLFYQSIVALQETAIGEDHIEILLRMEDDEGQLIMPGAFLPAAERYGLAHKIDRWVINQVLHYYDTYPNSMNLLAGCSINLSGRSLSDESFRDFMLERLQNVARQTREKLCFEITETAVIANLFDAKHFINALKQLGCRFALDDFGTGLSSFAYLRELPVDFLKIDGFFTKKITAGEIDLALVKSINDISHIMGLKTIAEYVENQAIQNIITELGVDYGQGYHLGQVLPLSTLVNPDSAQPNRTTRGKVIQLNFR